MTKFLIENVTYGSELFKAEVYLRCPHTDLITCTYAADYKWCKRVFCEPKRLHVIVQPQVETMDLILLCAIQIGDNRKVALTDKPY